MSNVPGLHGISVLEDHVLVAILSLEQNADLTVQELLIGDRAIILVKVAIRIAPPAQDHWQLTVSPVQTPPRSWPLIPQPELVPRVPQTNTSLQFRLADLAIPPVSPAQERLLRTV